MAGPITWAEIFLISPGYPLDLGGESGTIPA